MALTLLTPAILGLSPGRADMLSRQHEGTIKCMLEMFGVTSNQTSVSSVSDDLAKRTLGSHTSFSTMSRDYTFDPTNFVSVTTNESAKIGLAMETTSGSSPIACCLEKLVTLIHETISGSDTANVSVLLAHIRGFAS